MLLKTSTSLLTQLRTKILSLEYTSKLLNEGFSIVSGSNRFIMKILIVVTFLLFSLFLLFVESDTLTRKCTSVCHADQTCVYGPIGFCDTTTCKGGAIPPPCPVPPTMGYHCVCNNGSKSNPFNNNICVASCPLYP